MMRIPTGTICASLRILVLFHPFWWLDLRKGDDEDKTSGDGDVNGEADDVPVISPHPPSWEWTFLPRENRIWG
jgi:hypothetical protein